MHLYSIRKPNFDIERVKHGIQLFEGLKDYTTFCADTKNNSISYVRMLDKLTLEKSIPLLPFDPLSQNYEFWNFTFKSKGFLYNQVRRITASLISLGAGIITEKDITTMLQVPNHKNWLPHIFVAPAHGLYLANVEYCQNEIDEYTLKYTVESPKSMVATKVI